MGSINYQKSKEPLRALYDCFLQQISKFEQIFLFHVSAPDERLTGQKFYNRVSLIFFVSMVFKHNFVIIIDTWERDSMPRVKESQRQVVWILYRSFRYHGLKVYSHKPRTKAARDYVIINKLSFII